MTWGSFLMGFWIRASILALFFVYGLVVSVLLGMVLNRLFPDKRFDGYVVPMAVVISVLTAVAIAAYLVVN